MATLNLARPSNVSAAIPQIWEKAVMYDADRMSIHGRLTGSERSNAPVLEKEDLTKQAGDRINYVIYGRMLSTFRSGTQALQGFEDLPRVSSDVVTVEWFRVATAFDKKAKKLALGDLEAFAQKQLSDRLARFLDDNLVDQVINQDTVQTIYGGSATSRATLGPGSVLTATAFKRLHMAAQRRGVTPWQESNKSRMPFPIYGMLMNEVDYYNLVASDGFVQDVRLAAERGKNNPALDGNIDMYNGVMIYRWSSINPGDGMLGSFLRPEGRLSAALTAAATTVAVGAGTRLDNVDYAGYFPRNAATHTILIGNEKMTYVGVPTSGSENPGIGSDQDGGGSLQSDFLTVTRGAAGTTAAAHSQGDLVTQNNVGKVLLFGRKMAMQAWAQRPQRITQDYDYGGELGRGIDLIYEVKGIEAVDGTLSGAVVMETYSPNPSTV